MANHILQTLMYYLLLRTASTFSTRAICGLSQSPQKSFRNLKWVRRKFHPMASITANTVADSWADISPAHDESKFVPSNAMITHLTTKISWALQTWEGANEIDELTRMDIAKNVVDAIIRNKETNASDGDDRQQNKMLANYGLTVAKALRVTPGSLHELNKDFMLLEKTINKYQQHLEKNRAVYMNINKHHETMIKKSYTAAVSNTTSLEVYAEAANLMGKKVWVQEGNMWIEKYSIQFFRGNGARKDYLTSNNHDPNLPGHRELAESLPKDIMLQETFKEKFAPSSTAKKTEDISGNIRSSPRLIRLVDVGSCYNPIGKSENAAAFTVTALDLCPVDPSVYQCDFLELGIGPRDSTPIFYPNEPDRSLSDAMVDCNDKMSNQADMMSGLVKESVVSQRLAQLPAESYDVVSMSLVLNYLPTPKLREDMIKKARQLLIPPGDGGQPHRAGLLLITEKESIFSSDKKVDLKNEVEVEVEESSVRGSKSALLDSWVSTIESLGFKLVKYRNVLTPADHRRYHALAFRTVLFTPLKEPSLESSSRISLSEHSSIMSSSKNQEINEIDNNTDNKNDHDNFMLQKSIANLKKFKSGIKGMWIKQDFGISKKNGANTFNKTHHEFNNTMKIKRGILGSEGKVGLTGFLGPTVTTIIPSHPILVDTSNTSENSFNPPTQKSEIQNLIPDKGLSSCPPVNPLIRSNGKNAESSSSSSLISQDKNARMLPVAIVGGGLGGCALALSLQRKGIPYVMYEKDPHFTSRKQGYALTLMQGTTSLRILDLEKEYKRRGVPSLAHESFASDGTVLGSYGASVRNGLSGSAQKDNAIHYAESPRSSVVTGNDVQSSDRNTKNGEIEGDNRGENEMENEKEKEIIKEILGKKSARRQEKAKDKHNVHISRQQLRNLLMKNIPSSNVVWGKHFSHYIEKPDRVELCFHDGTRFEASVLVAADGIYSTIRKQLIPQKEEELQSMSKGLNYLNLMVILGISPVLLGSNASLTYPLTCIPPSLISVTDTETETVTETATVAETEMAMEMKMETEIATTTEMAIDTDLELNYSGDTGDHGSKLIPTKRKRFDDSAMFENYSYADVTPTSPVLDSDFNGATGGLEGKIPDPLPSRSQCQWLDGSTRVFTMPFDQSHTMWQLSFPCTEEEAYKLTANPVLLKEKALERCKGWHDPLVTLLSATDVQLVSGHPAYDRDPLAACDLQRAPREKTTDSERDLNTHSTLSSSPTPFPPSYTSTPATTTTTAGASVPIPTSTLTTTPVTSSTPLTSWTLGQYSRVTLLGDAAHPMSPFKAQGANQALMDAISLSDALGLSELTKPGGRSVALALDSYEKEMCARSAVKVLGSRTAAVHLHEPSAMTVGNATRARVAKDASS